MHTVPPKLQMHSRLTWLARRLGSSATQGLQLREACTQCRPPEACLHKTWLRRLQAQRCQRCTLSGRQLRKARM